MGSHETHMLVLPDRSMIALDTNGPMKLDVFPMTLNLNSAEGNKKKKKKKKRNKDWYHPFRVGIEDGKRG